MEQKTRHTYALPSSRRVRLSSSDSLSISSDTSTAPPSPRGRGILLPPTHYGRSPSPAFSNKSQPLASPSSMPDPQGYVQSEWALLGIERLDANSKFTVTLLNWPSMTLYTWPLDSRSPERRSQCFVTPTGFVEQKTSDPQVLRQSLFVLEHAVRTWIRYVRTKSPVRSGHVSLEFSKVVQICTMLGLTPPTEEQRNEWLKIQELPPLPHSTPSSRASSPMASPAGQVPSPDDSNPAKPPHE